MSVDRKIPGGQVKGGLVHVDAYDQQRHGHSVDVRQHYRSWPGSGGWYDGADLGAPLLRFRSKNLGMGGFEIQPKPEVLRTLGLTLDDFVQPDRRRAPVRHEQPKRRDGVQRGPSDASPVQIGLGGKGPVETRLLEANTAAPPRATPSSAAAKPPSQAAAQKGQRQRPNPQPGYLTDDGKPIYKEVRASQYVNENAATNKLPSQMQPSDAFIDAVKKIEGKNIDKKTGLHAEYRDEAGYPTIGYGHRLADKESYPGGITEEQAEALLRQDLQEAKNNVDRAVKVPIPQGMYDSLILLSYNVGSIAGSKLVAKMNAGDFDGASLEFRDWNNITVTRNGVEVLEPSDGLTARRLREEDGFNGRPFERK